MGSSNSVGQAIRVGVVGDIEEDGALVVPRTTSGTLDDIAVIFTGDRYYAIDNTCTHEQTSLAQGWIENGCVECPLHAATFRLSDGAALTQPATRGVSVHTIDVVGGELMLTPNPERLA